MPPYAHIHRSGTRMVVFGKTTPTVSLSSAGEPHTSAVLCASGLLRRLLIKNKLISVSCDITARTHNAQEPSMPGASLPLERRCCFEFAAAAASTTTTTPKRELPMHFNEEANKPLGHTPSS